MIEMICTGLVLVVPQASMFLTQSPIETYRYLTQPPQVIFDERILRFLEHKFASETHEYVYCLYGTIDNEVYTITRIEEPQIYMQSETMLLHAPCEKRPELIAQIHSHPNGQCDLSTQDKKIFQIDQIPIHGIQCDTDFFGLYTLQDMEHSLSYG
jgi:proteasome lid subunit RPN8/RPN11